MSRSLWKGPFSNVKDSSSNVANKKQDIWCRTSMILPKDIGKEFRIYNGKSWTLRSIAEVMVGHKFGEFSMTKKKVSHKINKTKQTSKKR